MSPIRLDTRLMRWPDAPARVALTPARSRSGAPTRRLPTTHLFCFDQYEEKVKLNCLNWTDLIEISKVIVIPTELKAKNKALLFCRVRDESAPTTF
ncbi:hypothetical protein EVAR_19242_1 [Eumeta japonica]|uniref:Uncharacterized protein n=1 Tax=Eumeta variegata TaxID=151549 RepID=A0A4C1VES7_EUMVA|nr:hypothetical protein EVAR_19242_1 [Eumeta japonica]